MKAKREFRDRSHVEVAVLDALVDRSEEGMTVFELRSHVEEDIDELEVALGSLKEDDLISATKQSERTVIKPDDRVIPDPAEDDDGEPSLIDRIIERLPL